MEKSWDDFWSTGKIEDYLSYKNSASNTVEKDTEETKGTHKEGMKGTWDSQSL